MKCVGEEIYLFFFLSVFKKFTFFFSWLFFKTLHVSGISAVNAAMTILEVQYYQTIEVGYQLGGQAFWLC